MELRPYQEDLISQALLAFDIGEKSLAIQLATGGGKTLLTASMVKTMAAEKKVVWFLVHRKELIDQSSDAFEFVGMPHGIISAGFSTDSKPLVQICSVQTLARRIDNIHQIPDLLVFDECHHLAAKSWDKIFSAFPASKKLGLTATPRRLDGKGLKKYFSTIIHGPKVRWLIDHGYLSDFKIFADATMDMSKAKKIGGDYSIKDSEAVADKPKITGRALSEYLEKCEGKRAIVFCTTIAHSLHVVETFVQAGVLAKHLDGETPKAERDAIVKEFRAGEIKVLSNVGLFGEGFDLPGIECAILLRPTASLSMYLQMVGRALRPSAGKSHAIILDHAGNCLRHGFPDDEFDWTLEDRPKKKSKDGPVVRLCPACFAAISPKLYECPECGHKFERPKDIPEGTDTKLQELKRSVPQQIADCRSLEDLKILGKQLGYHHGWAAHAWAARETQITTLKKIIETGHVVRTLFETEGITKEVLDKFDGEYWASAKNFVYGNWNSSTRKMSSKQLNWLSRILSDAKKKCFEIRRSNI